MEEDKIIAKPISKIIIDDEEYIGMEVENPQTYCHLCVFGSINCKWQCVDYDVDYITNKE